MASMLRTTALLCALALTSQSASAFFFFKDRYTETKHPIVLVHGLFGFDSLLGLDYFYQIVPELERSGAEVFVAQVSAVNSNTARGEQLLAQVQQFLAISGADKVNLIGHSQGGPTSRYVAGIAPELVASVTTVASPNGFVGQPDGEGGVFDDDALLSVVGTVIDALSGGNLPQDPQAFIAESRFEFNQQFPKGLPTVECGVGPAQVDGQFYFSWSGTGLITTGVDVSDYVLAATGAGIDGENDGLIERCSSHFGTVIRDDFFQNHLDEVNQLFGVTALFATDPVTLYRQQANRLRKLGL